MHTEIVRIVMEIVLRSDGSDGKEDQRLGVIGIWSEGEVVHQSR